jgi:hypothetical protein
MSSLMHVPSYDDVPRTLQDVKQNMLPSAVTKQTKTFRPTTATTSTPEASSSISIKPRDTSSIPPKSSHVIVAKLITHTIQQLRLLVRLSNSIRYGNKLHEIRTCSRCKVATNKGSFDFPELSDHRCRCRPATTITK